MSRILSLDYGERRIGVALSDPSRTIATPFTTLHRRAGKRPPWPEIQKLIADNDVGEAVIGLPLALSGDESEWTAEVRAFGADLARRTGLDVHWMDERMTSVAAERSIRAMGLKRAQRESKERIDAAAAALILESYLTLRRNQTLNQP
jgi:putative Holliday junction resolvase